MYEERLMKSAREGARLISRDELEAAPGAALAIRRVRAAGAAARTGKPIHCKRRAGSAQLCIRLCSRRRRDPLSHSHHRKPSAAGTLHEDRDVARGALTVVSVLRDA